MRVTHTPLWSRINEGRKEKMTASVFIIFSIVNVQERIIMKITTEKLWEKLCGQKISIT